MAVSAETSRSPRMISVIRFDGTPSAFASARALISSGTRYSSRSTSPGWVRTRAMINSSMIIHDRYIFRTFGRPSKAHPPLPVDPDTVLTCAVALQGFELVAGRRSQIGKSRRSIEHIELAQRHRLECAPAGRTITVPKKSFGCPVGKAPDHALVCVT